jgi:hypothetical protein
MFSSNFGHMCINGLRKVSEVLVPDKTLTFPPKIQRKYIRNKAKVVFCVQFQGCF